MPPRNYRDNVFINCPFDDSYLGSLFRPLIFAIIDCGYIPRSTLEEEYSSENRLARIVRLIRDCKYGIHDLSRVELSPEGLPRFNMPFELGLFLGAKRFGQREQARKNCLIMHQEVALIQTSISDLSGVDIHAHRSDPRSLVTGVRNWLAQQNRTSLYTGADVIWEHFEQFEAFLPQACTELELNQNALTFNEYNQLTSTWLTLAD